MSDSILKKVDAHIKKYKAENKGEVPLYIIAYPDDADILMEEVKKLNGQDSDNLVTSYKKIKIVKHDILNQGEFRLSNELPETGS